MVSKLVVTLTTRPQPRATRCGTAKRAIRKAPPALIARMRVQPSGAVSQKRSGPLQPGGVAGPIATPAQLTRMSMPPKAARISAMARSQSAGAATSALTGRSVPPPELLETVAACRCSPATSRSTPATLAPAAARARAMTAPMPLAAPVTTATLPASGVPLIVVSAMPVNSSRAPVRAGGRP